MNASTKKLLSMLVVMAMVLSMVPTFTLPAIAAETEPANATVTPGQANLTAEQAAEVQRGKDVQAAANAIVIPAEGTTFEAECPVCKKTVTWTKKTNAIGGIAADGNYHYVWQGTIDPSNSKYNWISTQNRSNTTVCILMRDAVLTGGGTIMNTGTNVKTVTMNFMGTGTLTSDGSDSQGFGLLKANAQLNLYGGTYIYTGNNRNTTEVTADGNKIFNVSYGALKVNGASAQTNIYADAVIGQAAKATNDAGAFIENYNVLVYQGTLNMYGGTIQNGVSGVNSVSGNVTIANGGTFNMYGGEVKDGDYSVAGMVGGNIVIGGRFDKQTSYTAGTFNMYGGTISGGKSKNGGNGGGNISLYGGSTAEKAAKAKLMGGTIKDGEATYGGGNIAVQNANNELEIGGTVLITNGKATNAKAYGANILVKPVAATVTMTGGYITGGDVAKNADPAYYGGAFSVGSNASLEITGGEISGCRATEGGAVYVTGAKDVTIGGTAKLDNNQATNFGGSVALYDAATVSVTGGTICNGHTTSTGGSGGNISAAKGCVVNVSGGNIYGGYNPSGNGGGSWGGNIRCWQGTVNISGGYIYNGYAKDGTTSAYGNYAAGNIGVLGDGSASATLNISGGNIGGDIGLGSATSVKLSGTPKIKYSGLKLADGTSTANKAHYNGIPGSATWLFDISELQPGAEIQVTANVGTVFTKADANAANVVSCFTSTAGSSRVIELQADNTLKLVDAPVEEPTKDKFEPEKFNGEAYCPVCEKFVIWTAYEGGHYNDKTAYPKDDHLYLADNHTIEDGNPFLVSYRKICFNLNGKTLSGQAPAEGKTASTYMFHVRTLNMIDTEGTAVVAGYTNKSSTAATIHLNNGGGKCDVTIYGGTFTKLAEDTLSPIIMIGGNGGKITIKDGAVIDASGKTGSAIVAAGNDPALNNNYAYAIVDIAGGEIKGGTAEYGGALNLGQYVSSATISDGTISGGIATKDGGNIYSASPNLIISGGTITGGSAVNGGNIFATSAGVEVKGDSTITGGIADNDGGNIYADKTTLTISGGTISNGVAKGLATNNGYGGNIYATATTVNMSAGTITGGTVKRNDNNRGGGNVMLNSNSVMNMSGGVVKDGVAGDKPETNKKTNAGNILVNTNCTLNMSGNAEVYGGLAGNQGGNIRAWKGDVNMSGNAKIYGGTAYRGAPNVWLVCSDMTMTDNAQVLGEGTTVNNAINVAAYGEAGKNNTVISTLTLSGNATVKSKEGNSNNSIGVNWTLNTNADATDDAVSKLIITNDWTGEAYFYTTENMGVEEGASKSTLVTYSSGETFNDNTVVCGTLAQDGTFTKGGSFSGKLYYSGPAGTLCEDGNIIVGKASVQGENGETWYKSEQAALDAYYVNDSFTKGEYLLVGGNTTLTMNGDVIIESRGYTVTLDGTGTVYMLDRANDDYEGYGLWNISGEVKVASEATNPVNGNRYISIKSDGGHTAHRFEMKLTHVTLRTNAGGMYYKAKIMCDNVLAKRVNGYGVVVSRQDMPGADFMDEAEGSNGFTMYEKLTPNAEHTVTTTSGSIFNIVKDPSVVVEGEKVRTPEQNDANIEEKVYANLYLSVDRLDTGILDDCEYFVADNKNCGTQNGIAFSLLDVVSMINDNWGAYSETQQTLVKSTIITWGSWLTSAKANALLAELDKIFA